MKKTISLILVTLFLSVLQAQDMPSTTTRTTVFETFQPAKITLTDGRIITQNQANVFLKNSSLVYKRGRTTMEAEPSQIRAVEIGGVDYVMVDTVLASVIDTLGNSKLLCVTMIDVDAYRTQLMNNTQMTNLEIGAHVNFNSANLTPDDEQSYPLMRMFYFDINGDIVKVHDRTVQKLFPKEKRRLYKTIIQTPGFKWDDPDSLMRLLREII